MGKMHVTKGFIFELDNGGTAQSPKSNVFANNTALTAHTMLLV